MTQVINFSVDQSQLHSPGSFLGQSTGFLEVSTTYRSFIGARVGSTSVTGKRILSQSALYRPENDNSSKYPIPVQVFKKPKKPRKTLDIQNEDNSNLSQKYLSRSKTERKSLGKIQPKPPIHPSKAKLAKETTKMSKTLILNKHLVQSKSQKKMTENKKSPSKSFSIPEIKIKEIEIKPEFAKTTDDKGPRNVIRIDDIVKNTLIQEKVKKVKKIKAEQKQKVENELRKFEQKVHNNQIRQENSVKFRQEKFHPKIAWGANEKKILGLDTIKLQKEIEEERRHKREIRARTKSAEKDRLGLETLAELKLELGTISRSKSVSQEIVKPFKAAKKPDPKVKAFIKVKKQSRKESKEQEMLHHQAEEAKRLTQLKQLDIFAKSHINLKKKKKRKLSKKKNSKKKPTKTWIEDSNIGESEEQSYQPLSSRRAINEHSDSKESFQEHFITQAINKGKEDLKTQDILKKHIQYTNLEHNNQSGNIDFQDSSINDPNLLESSSSNGKIINESNTSIEYRKNDIKKRLDDLRYRIGKVKENLLDASPETQNQAATKIQANVRRFLTQKRLERENFADEDEEVQQILSKDPTKFKKNLEIQIEKSPYSPSDTSSEIPPENLMNILSPKTSTTNLEDRLIEELKNIEEIKHQKDEFKDILKYQLIWQENQKQNLQKLKEKELRELKEVTKKLGQGKELEKMLAEIIENRYLHLTNLIVENIANVQEALTREQNLKQNDEQNMREYTGDSSSESSCFESQGSDKFMELFSGKIQKNIESDSDSLKPDELEKLMRELNKNRKFEEIEDLSKLKAVSEMENATENEEDLKQFSDAPSYLSNISVENPQKIKSPTFGQTITEPDECDEIIQKIMSNESYKNSENESLKIEESKESFQEQKSSFECINELEVVKEASQEQKTSFMSSTSSIKKNESLVEIESKSEEIVKETDSEIENLYDSENQEIESPQFPPNPPMGSPQISEGPSIESFELPKNILNLQQAEIFVEEFKSPETSAFVTHHDDSLDDLQILTPEPSLQPPESPIERPSAPFLSSDSEDDKSKPLTPLPELKLEASDAKIHLSPDLYRNVTPELISMLSESILEMLLSEDIIPKPSFPIFMPEEIANPEPSLHTEPVIQTDHLSVQKYVDEIFELALQNIDDFIINLRKPLKRNPLEVLSRMQAAKIGTPIEVEFVLPPAVLNVNYYLNLEHARDVVYPERCLSPNAIQMISEAEHIHNKMIFDAANEALQKYRPYGLKGIPLPWSTSNRQLVDFDKKLSTMIEEIKKVIEKWSLVQAGKIPTQDMVLTGGNFDEEYLQQMREERLASMLADDIIEKDNIWVEYEFEEVQVKLDLADMVLEDLVIETFNILDQDN